MNENDFPKSVVFFLVVLAVFITLAGTWAVLSEMGSDVPVTKDTTKATGRVSVNIVEPQKQETTTAVGQVSINIEGGK